MRLLRGLCAECSLAWTMIKSYFTLMRGVWHLSHLPGPRVSIFGGARLPLDHQYADDARRLARLLVEGGTSVITGGGGGIMEAANCGAAIEQGTARSIGIGVTGLQDEMRNECSQDYLLMRDFAARKWLLTRYSRAFVVFPGGCGTLDELGEILTLMQTKKMERAPIVLFGTEYWAFLWQWLKESAVPLGLVPEDNVDLMCLTDDVDIAFQKIKKFCDVRRTK